MAKIIITITLVNTEITIIYHDYSLSLETCISKENSVHVLSEMHHLVHNFVLCVSLCSSKQACALVNN